VRWADTVPDLLTGLREGLGAGLVVSILLAALRKTTAATGQRVPAAPLCLGVLGAVMVSGSFAAILTFGPDALSSRAEETVGGLFSVLTVVLVTGMIFRMRRTARTLTARPGAAVTRAVTIGAGAGAIGAGALTLTAFLAVGRESLETTLVIWAALKAPGSATAPLAGAGLGLAAAVVLCWLLYRQATALDPGKFFNRGAIVLIVIAAGTLAYGLGDLQEAGWLPGQHWIAFDLTARAGPGSWWVSVISGVTELTPKLTVLQAYAWTAYLAVVVPAFVLARGLAGAPARWETRWERMTARHPWRVAGGVVVAPALAAGLLIAAWPASADPASATSVTVTSRECAPQWSSGHTGPQVFYVDNQSGMAGGVSLDDAAGAVVAEIESIGPATTVSFPATLGAGSYTFVCVMSRGTTRSAPVRVTGGQWATTFAVKPVTASELEVPNLQYQAYAAADLVTLQADVSRIQADLAAGDLAAARQDWLTAQMDWERVGASYDSFGAPGLAVDGLPGGLPLGVNDPGFTGLHRLEYGLYHGQSAAELLPVVATLSSDITTVQGQLSSAGEVGDPVNLPVRAHEILEDALRDHLSGLDDEGAGAAYPETYADTQVTATILGELQPLITARAPKLMPVLRTQLAALQAALLATRSGGQWVPASQVPQAAGEQVDSAIGALLENLSAIPDLLQVPLSPRDSS
jgi:high-affinity iron transporter